jgi:hypothetical protein
MRSQASLPPGHDAHEELLQENPDLTTVGGVILKCFTQSGTELALDLWRIMMV